MLIVEQEPACQTIRGQVLRVFDGDGFMTRLDFPERRISADVSIRLGFIDAPEMDQPGGKEARDLLRSIIGGKTVDLAILTKMDTGGIVDRHGRVVAVPYLPPQAIASPWSPRVAPPRNVELEMVVNGFAWVLDRYCPDDVYYRALEDAQTHRRGIWAFDDNIHPWEYKKQRYRNRPKAPSPVHQDDLFAEASKLSSCPKGCGGKEVKKTGRFGQFIGCSNFPTCRCTRNL